MGHLKNFVAKKRHLPPGEAQTFLKEEITQLEKQLEGQIVMRNALEKAMNNRLRFNDQTYQSLTQPAGDLIKEVAILEMEVAYLEKYLLSMYRRTFSKRLSTLPKTDERRNPTSKRALSDFFKPGMTSANEDKVDNLPTKCSSDILGAETLVDSGIGRSQSSLSDQRWQAVSEALDLHHSLPLSMLEVRAVDGHISSSGLEEQLGSGLQDCLRETPHWLSEEMVKCISTIYLHLSDSPFSHSSPMSKFSPRWSQQYEESQEFSGPFLGVVEVRNILRDSKRLSAVEDLLHNFRFLISRLAQVDPSKLKHDEKLAFWINVHNSLVMHAFLVYGTPRGNLKRFSLVLKAAYNIGGHTISIEIIQSSILGCRLPRPAQWLQSLFFPKMKFKGGESHKAYAIKHPEARLHFALSLGCHSDPIVRLYTPEKVFQELEIAKEEYIQSNVRLHKEQKLLIPKNVEYYIKEMGLYPNGIGEVIDYTMHDSLKKNFQQPHPGKLWKKIEWIPHNFTFRFLLSSELAK